MRSIAPALALLVFVLAAPGPRFFDDPGVGWHLATGELVLSSWTPPRVDPFRATSAPEPWVADQWLGSTLMAASYRLAHWKGLLLFLTGTFATLFFIILPAGIAGSGGIHATATLIAALLTAKLATVHLIARPVVLGLFFFGLVFASLLRTERRSASYPWAYGLITLPLFALWANIHPSFPLGIGLLILFLLQSLMLHRHHCPTMVVAIAAAVVGSFITPYGLDLHQSILALIRSDYFMGLNAEWRPPALDSGEAAIALALILLTLLGLYLNSRTSSPAATYPPSVFALIVSLLFAEQSIDSVRYLPYFAVALTPLLALAISGSSRFIQGFLATMWFRISPLMTPFELSLRATRITTSLLLSILGITLLSLFPPPWYPQGPSSDRYPFSLLPQLRSLSGPINNHPDLGGFLIWFSEGKLKPLIDDRNYLNGESAYQRFFAFQSGDPSAEIQLPSIVAADSPVINHWRGGVVADDHAPWVVLYPEGLLPPPVSDSD